MRYLLAAMALMIATTAAAQQYQVDRILTLEAYERWKERMAEVNRMPGYEITKIMPRLGDNPEDFCGKHPEITDYYDARTEADVQWMREMDKAWTDERRSEDLNVMYDLYTRAIRWCGGQIGS